MNYQMFLIDINSSVMEALKKINDNGKKILFVTENNKLIGSLTDGDIRRHILNGGSIEEKLEKVCNKNTFKLKGNYNQEELLEKAKNLDIKYFPVVSDENEIIEILSIEEIKTKAKVTPIKELDIPTIVMAGGFGKRMEPLTKIIPKALIPIGNKTILESIIEKIGQYGVKEFILSLNYKSQIIKSYISELSLPYKIIYVQEDIPLGTAGSLSLMKKFIKSEDFLLTNCDVILDIDYIDFYNFHVKMKSHLTLVGCKKNYQIQYGICEIDEQGTLKNIQEKPQINFIVNTGLYLLKRETIELIPPNKHFNMTDLINKLKRKKKKILTYVIQEDQFVDLGELEQYKDFINTLLRNTL